jgi:hypothetical protein
VSTGKKNREKDTESDKKVKKRYAENLENCEQISKMDRLVENRDIYLLFSDVITL